MKPGLYEQLIDDLLSREIEALLPAHLFVHKEPVDRAESHVVLARYVRRLIETSLRVLSAEDGRDRLHRQVELCNRLIATLRGETSHTDLSDRMIPAETEMLPAILERMQAPLPLRAAQLPIRPETRLSQSSLFTGSRTEPSLATPMWR